VRRVIPVLLLALLLAAQHGAVVHSLQHFAATVAAAGTTDPQPSPADDFCEKCLTHAAVGCAINGASPTLVLVANAAERIAPLPAVEQPANLPSPRSRGPPSLL